jgi:hypothetical protein
MTSKKRDAKKAPIKIGRGSKFLCPICGTLKTFHHTTSRDELFLNCGHTRPVTLPTHSGCVSIEHLLSRDPLVIALAGRMFPQEPPVIYTGETL